MLKQREESVNLQMMINQHTFHCKWGVFYATSQSVSGTLGDMSSKEEEPQKQQTLSWGFAIFFAAQRMRQVPPFIY